MGTIRYGDEQRRGVPSGVSEALIQETTRDIVRRLFANSASITEADMTEFKHNLTRRIAYLQEQHGLGALQPLLVAAQAEPGANPMDVIFSRLNNVAKALNMTGIPYDATHHTVPDTTIDSVKKSGIVQEPGDQWIDFQP